MNDNLLALQHVSIIVSDTQTSIDFYQQHIGVTVNPNRPDLGYPGAWLDINNDQQIHLLELPNPDPLDNRPKHGGRDRHAAFIVQNIQIVIDSLDQAGIPYTMSNSGRKALFFRDPDSNALEIVERKTL